MTACLCILGGLLAVCGDVVCKRWADGGAPWVLVAGCGVYAVDACVWAAILRRGILLSVGAVAWSATSLLMGFLAGIAIYGERPPARKCAGAVFALLGVLMVGGCTRTSEVKTDDKLDVQQEVKARSTEQTAETVQTGPETITTTTEEYTDADVPDAVVGPAPGVAARSAGAVVPVRAQLPASRLVKRTVTVDQRGPVLDTKNAVTQTAKDTSLAEKQEKASDTKKKTSYWPPWWVWALGACGVALGIAVARKTLLGKAVAAAEAAAKEVL